MDPGAYEVTRRTRGPDADPDQVPAMNEAIVDRLITIGEYVYARSYDEYVWKVTLSKER